MLKARGRYFIDMGSLIGARQMECWLITTVSASYPALWFTTGTDSIE